MDRVVLQKNIINGVNVINQEAFCQNDSHGRTPRTNTVYVIQYEFILGENIVIPDNCVLEFNGGSLSGSNTITFNETLLSGRVSLDINCSGTITNTRGLLSWFKDSSTNSHNLCWLIKNCYETDIDKDITLDAPIDMGNHKINLYSSNNSIIKVNCAPSFPYLTEFCSWVYSHNSPSVSIHDITVDFEKRQFVYPSRNYGVRVANMFFVVSAAKCEFYNIHIKNYGDNKRKREADSFVGISVRPSGIYTVNMRDLIFENIKITGDGKIGGAYAGMGGCISITATNNGNIRVSPITINNVSCKNCYSTNTSGTPIIDDFDCIYIGASDDNDRLSECSITNCCFEGINKRGIKVCCQNVSIDGVYYSNPDRIEGMAELISPQSPNCTINNVYAYPTTTCSIILSTITRQFTVSDCVIIPSSTDLNVKAISGCAEIKNCFFKDCRFPIVRAFTNEINDMIPGKFHGYRMESESIQYDNVSNCTFENCLIAYDQLFSSIRTCAYFKDCLFYDCLRINTGDTFVAENCRFIRTNNCRFVGAFLETKIWRVFTDNNPTKKELTSNTKYTIQLKLKNCSFDAGGNAAHLISSHLTDYNPKSVDVDLAIEDCNLKNFTSDGEIIAGNEKVNFNSLLIDHTDAPNIRFKVHSNWSGKVSLVNSVLDAYYGKSHFQTSKDLIVRDATINAGKLSLSGVFVQPSYNYISDILFENMPKEGTFYWQNGMPTWSDGARWVDSTGKPL